MSTEKVPVFKPLIEAEELNAATKALELRWLGMGSFVASFEENLARFLELQDRYVATVSTGHAALHLAMLLSKIGPGDEVLTPAFNNIADFQAILAVGAQPVFCDIDPTTLCIDLDKAKALITKKTKAIIAMDYDCILCDHESVQRLADEHGLRVIHDAAHSLGSRYKGKQVGSFSDICMFSFDPVKTITCIDGGALVVRSKEELEEIHELRLIGMGQPASVMYQNQRAWTYDVRRVGFRYHMANLHAAIGISQLEKMPKISAARRAACQYYNQQLAEVKKVRTPATDFKDVTPFLYYIRVPAADRDALRKHLLEDQIDTGIHWQPGHWFSLLKDCRRGDLSVTDVVGHEILSLPLHSDITKSVQDRVINSIRTYFEAQR